MAFQRLPFIDILRGIACIWMIETHAVNAFLDAAFMNSPWFTFVKVSNGFVAVTFIFCAGAGFRLALEAKMRDYLSFEKPLWAYIRRLLFIMAIGYSLQPPSFSLAKMLDFTPAQWITFLDCNVLQLIVASSFLALMGLLAIRSMSGFIVFSWLMVTAIFLGTPLVWSLNPEVLSEIPTFFRMYVSTQPQVSFPLFPWAGYYFAGCLATHYFITAPSLRNRAFQYVVFAPLLIGVVYLSSRISWTYYDPMLNWWLVSPMHMLFRVGGALFLFGGLYLFQERLKGPVSNMLALNGKESLVVYVGQGIIIYGAGMQAILRLFLPDHPAPLHIAILTIAVIGFMYGYAYSWNRYKKSMPKHAEWTLRLCMFIYFLTFLFNPH